MKTVFDVLTGSRLYGTDTPESDFDFKRVVLPPLNDMIAYKPISVTREYPQGPDGNIEVEVIPLQKFLIDVGLGKIYAAEIVILMNRPLAAMEWWTQPLLRNLPRNNDFTVRTFDGDDVDRRAMMHTLRFVQEIAELNSTGTIRFPRPNVGYLAGLRNGTVPLDDARDALAEAYAAASAAYDNSILPVRDAAYEQRFEEFKLELLRRSYGLMPMQQ